MLGSGQICALVTLEQRNRSWEEMKRILCKMMGELKRWFEIWRKRSRDRVLRMSSAARPSEQSG